MLAIGNDELGESVKKGDYVRNKREGMEGYLEHPIDENGDKLDIIGYVIYNNSRNSPETHLVSISGRMLRDWKLVYTAEELE